MDPSIPWNKIDITYSRLIKCNFLLMFMVVKYQNQIAG